MIRKKRIMDEGPGADVGMLMSVCLFLILLTFFVLLNSIAVIDEIKSRLAIGSLVGAFGSFKGGLSPLSTGHMLFPPSAPMIEDELSIEEMLESMKGGEIVGKIKTESLKDRQIITIDEEVLFEKDRSGLRSSSYPLLNKLCTFIENKDYPVEILGHTDNRPAEEKGHKSNWEISTLMAIQVVRYLAEKGKVPPQRLTAFGCSSYKPIASDDTRESRAQNRRIEIILHFEIPHYVKRIYRKKPAGIFSYKNFDFRVF